MRRAALLIAAMVLGATVLGASLEARAQDLSDLPPSTTTGIPLTSGVEQQRPFWRGSGETRFFFASTTDVGAIFLRPMAHVGYGKPHYRWIGLDFGSGLSLGTVSGYAGLRGVYPGVLDVRVGAHYQHPTGQRYLPRQESYIREDLDHSEFGRGAYIAAEAEIASALPIPSGSLIAVLTGMYIGNVPDDANVFVQAQRVVLEPPWLWRGRLGYLYHFGWEGTMKLGVTAEIIHLVKREDFVIRAGPVLSVALTHHLEALAAAMIVARSPDSLGLSGADLGQLGLRYRWATGDAWAAFP